MTRANRISIVNKDGQYVATLYKTHKVVATVYSSTYEDNEWIQHDINDKTTTSTMIREDFRQFVIAQCGTLGIEYDPTDRRDADNVRKAAYATREDIEDDIVMMITADIQALCDKSTYADRIKDISIVVDDVIPMYTTSSGRDLTTMGVEDGRYIKNGNWAWADINVRVQLVGTDFNCYDVYLDMALVSGQLKKFRLSPSAWNGLLKAEFDAEDNEDVK